MSAGFRSRWLDWTPESSETPLSPAVGRVDAPVARVLTFHSPACPSCGAAVAPDVVLCGPCYEARRAPGRVLPFDPGRRLRTIARLSGRACDGCGAIDWQVTPRGDSFCRPCARSRAALPVPEGVPHA